MRIVPETISRDWIETLTDADLVDVERRVHAKFALLERREKKIRGARYELFRGSAELVTAWHKWSFVSNVTRERSLKPVRETVAVGE